MAKDPANEAGRVVVTARPIESLNEKPRLSTTDKILDPGGAIADSVDNVANRERERGHLASANVLKASSGAISVAKEFADPRALNPVSAATIVVGKAAGMIVNHLNNPDLVVEHLAKDGYGKNDKGIDPQEYLADEYTKFRDDMNDAKRAKTHAGQVGGVVGSVLLNVAVGAEVVVPGGRTVNRFAEMVHNGGNVEEYKRLEKFEGIIYPDNYIELKGLRGKDDAHKSAAARAQSEQDMKGLEKALKLGGFADEYIDNLKKGTTEQYFREQKKTYTEIQKDKRNEQTHKKLGVADKQLDAHDKAYEAASAIKDSLNSKNVVASSSPITGSPLLNAPTVLGNQPAPQTGRGLPV